jgi:hypothetical protein
MIGIVLLLSYSLLAVDTFQILCVFNEILNFVFFTGNAHVMTPPTHTQSGAPSFFFFFLTVS